MTEEPDAIEFVNEAFRHCKAIAARGEGVNFLKEETYVRKAKDDKAIILSDDGAKDAAKILSTPSRNIATGREKKRGKFRRKIYG